MSDPLTIGAANSAGLPPCWLDALSDDLAAPYFVELQAFLEAERAERPVFPPVEQVYSAFQLTPLDSVRVVILGQDPYHDDGQANGLSFSVRPGVKIPPSLRNIFRELEADLGIQAPDHGNLQRWAEQGVLLLNSVLTVRAHEAHSHRNRGWEVFTDKVIDVINARPAVGFVLWGKPAQKKSGGIDDRHLVIKSAHPSPLSARRGFFGSRPFSRINSFLKTKGEPPIDWRLA